MSDLPPLDHTTPEAEAEALRKLETTFLEALARKEAGDVDRAEEMLSEILKQEPRLPEPRMELARLFLDTERIAAAEEHARLAVDHIEAGGQWTEMLAENVVKSIAHALLAETLRRRLDQDDMIFGKPDAYKAMLSEAKVHFEVARDLDPTDETSSFYAYFLGPEGHGGERVPATEED